MEQVQATSVLDAGSASDSCTTAKCPTWGGTRVGAGRPRLYDKGWGRTRFNAFCFSSVSFDLSTIRKLLSWLERRHGGSIYILLSLHFCHRRCCPYLFGLVEVKRKARVSELLFKSVDDKAMWQPLWVARERAVTYLKSSGRWRETYLLGCEGQIHDDARVSLVRF